MGGALIVGLLVAGVPGLDPSLPAAATSTRAEAFGWDPSWRRQGPADWAVTGGLLLSAGAVQLLNPEPPLGWRSAILFDAPLRSVLRAESEAGRDAASWVSDALEIGLVVAPFADLAALRLADRVDAELALQLALIDLEANALSLAVVSLLKSAVGRVRPQAEACRGADCPSRVNRQSFPSGHATAAFTGAGLICAHHRRRSYWGEASAWACPTALALATATATLRVVADRHWTSDVVAGAALGLLSGWALPGLLHYGADPHASEDAGVLRGALSLSGLVGGLAFDGPAGVVGGARLGVESRWWIDEGGADGGWLAVSGRLEGRLLRTARDFRHQQLSLAGLLWWRGLGLGFGLDFTSGRDAGPGDPAWLAGPELAVGLLRGLDTEIELRARWLPLLDGTRDVFEVRLRAALFRWWTIDVSAAALVPTEVGGLDGELFLLGLGGRLPW
jgi:membrane-associated phospholipid phosphatase